MQAWLDFAEGPLFRFAFAIMVLGLIRLLIITFANLSKMRAQTHDKSTDVWQLVKTGVAWMSPYRWAQGAPEQRPWYTAASFLFHLGLIVVPIFFLAHLELWRDGLGFAWIGTFANGMTSISSSRYFSMATVFDALTIITIVTGVILVIMRITNSGSRALSSFQDWMLTPLCVIIFATGYLAAHPTSNPFSYSSVRLIHVLAGNFVLLLMPFTKLSHVVLIWFTHAVWDLSWKFTPGVGDKVRAALGHQDKPI